MTDKASREAPEMLRKDAETLRILSGETDCLAIKWIAERIDQAADMLSRSDLAAVVPDVAELQQWKMLVKLIALGDTHAAVDLDRRINKQIELASAPKPPVVHHGVQDAIDALVLAELGHSFPQNRPLFSAHQSPYDARRFWSDAQ